MDQNFLNNLWNVLEYLHSDQDTQGKLLFFIGMVVNSPELNAFQFLMERLIEKNES